jgi:nitroreductase
MELKDIVATRRTLRDFDPSHAMPDEDLNQIIAAARSTPTSFNIQNWRFVAIRDRGIKEKIKRAAWDQAQVGVNSVLIAVCADLNAWNDNTERYWADNGADTAAHMAGMTRGFYNGKPQVQRDEAMRSVGMAATAIMWAATDLGYACSPMIGFDPDATAAAINLPEDHVVGMLIAIGKSNSAPYPKTEIDLAEILKYDFFPS